MTINFIKWADYVSDGDEHLPVGNKVKFFDSYDDALLFLFELQKLKNETIGTADEGMVLIQSSGIGVLTYSSKAELISGLNQINTIDF